MLSFFGVASVNAWDEVYKRMACAFRQSKAHEVKPGSVAAWLRLGEIAAQDVRCNPYNRTGLRDALLRLRALTSEPPEVFGPEVQSICATHGVAVVFVEEIAGARASGATRWLTPSKALVQLSLRYRTDDHLWFTFFHELAHVLLHGKKDLIIEDSGPATDDPKETEADLFSRDLLIPPSAAAELSHLKTAQAVREFAARLGVAPGIVVGRLQHDGYWSHSRGHQLKRKLALANTGTGAA
jgi:HTH-type transcriptional regulator/antitoxin HigA